MFKKSELIFIFFLLVAITVTFAPALRNGFTNWEDPEYLLENHSVKNLTPHHIQKIFTTSLDGRYNPLPLLIFGLEYQLWDTQAVYYHLTSLILHIANCTLVFLMLRQLTQQNVLSMVTTLLFALHPTQTEAVAWVVGQRDLLCALFYFLGLHAYLQPNTKRTFLFFILSLLCKPSAVTFPLALILIDYWKTSSLHHSQIKNKWPFFAASFISGCWALVQVRDAQVFQMSQFFNHIDRILFSSHAALLYLEKLFIPTQLSCYYPMPEKIAGYLPAIYPLSPILVAAIFFYLWPLIKNNPIIRWGFLFFAVHILVGLHLIHINNSIIYDRFLYIPSLGIFIVIGYLTDKTIKHFSTHALWIILIGILFMAALGRLTFERTQVWKNSETLWSDVLKQFPHAELAYLNLGIYYENHGNLNIALRSLNKSLKLNPFFAPTYVHRGNVFSALGLEFMALKDYNHAIRLAPDFSEAYNNRGNSYIRFKKYNLAYEDFSQAIALDENNLMGRLNRGMINIINKNYDEARTDFIAALLIDPGNKTAQIKLSDLEINLK